MSDQNVQQRRPHTTKDEDSITTESKRSSKPHDLEKGDTQVLPYSNEHEKEFSNIQRDPTLESRSDTNNQLGVVKHRVVRRHWVSVCLIPHDVLPTEHTPDTCDHVHLDLLRCLIETWLAMVYICFPWPGGMLDTRYPRVDEISRGKSKPASPGCSFFFSF